MAIVFHNIKQYKKQEKGEIKMRKRMMSRGLAMVMAALTAVTAVPATFVQAKTTYEASTKDVYVLVNIPYAKLYQSDVKNNVDVDVFTSATINKVKTKNMAFGTYHQSGKLTGSDGQSKDTMEILGATFPVKLGNGVTVADLAALGGKAVKDSDTLEIESTVKGQVQKATYEGKDTLFEAPSYSYYVLSETPAYYKTVTKANGSLSFGKTNGNVTKTIDLTADEYTFTTDTSYGDYELDLDATKVKSVVDNSTDQIRQVVIQTDKNSYGLRAVDNVWLGTKLGWCTTDYITQIHGCPTTYKHYASMEGQTIQSVLYYTDKGIYQFNLANGAKVTPHPESKLSATYKDGDLTKVKVSGISSKMKNVKVSVVRAGGHGATEVIYTQDATPDKNGYVTLSQALNLEDLPTVTVSCDNYAVTKPALINEKDAPVVAQSQKIVISSAKTKTYKASKLKKKAQTFTIKASAKTALSYKASNKKVTVNKKGLVTVKKGTKKGTYKITVTAAKTANYNAATAIVTVKVK